MTKISIFAKATLAVAFLIFFNTAVRAQLSAGDILFTGYLSNAATTDEFSFVLMKNIPSGTTISFTDNGWLATNVFRVGEQTVTLTTSSALSAGTEIRIFGPPAGAATATAYVGGSPVSAGSCTGTMNSFATSGDQIIAYTGTAGAPTMIAAIHMNVYSTDLGQCSNTTSTSWDPACITDNANFSTMPLGLSDGVSAVWIGTAGVGASEQDNAVFNCTGPLGTTAQIRAAVTNSANWNANSVAPPNMTLPSRCAFLIPTAAEVTIGGRIVTPAGRGISNAIVTLTDQIGNSRTARSSSLGYYRFAGVESGVSYTITVDAKGRRFTPRLVSVDSELADLDIVADGMP